MKIIFVHSPSDMYGASRSLLRLTSRLVRDGNQVIVILPYEGPLCSELVKSGVEIVIHRLLPVITRQRLRGLLSFINLFIALFCSIFYIYNFAKKYKPDIIHTNTALILSPGIVARLLKIPHFWHIRESFIEYGPVFRLFQWLIYSTSDKIICVSNAVAEQFSNKIRKRKVKVLNNGFPVDEFVEIPNEEVIEFRRRHGINNHLAVGVVGRIKYTRKGQDIFVRAAALLREQFPDVRFIIIGSPFPGNEHHLFNLKMLMKELNVEDRIILTGDVIEIKTAYASLDIVVLPSAQPEPFGGVVIEAMAMGKPVIGTAIGGTVEQIENGMTGFLVKPDEPQGLASAMGKLIADSQLRLMFGENGKKRFLEKFEFERFYQMILEMYSYAMQRREKEDLSNLKERM